jgi:hypothetical protein
MLHDFRKSLAMSHAQADADWWPTVYRKAFPSFDSMSCVRNDGWAQRGGIDRVIVLKSSKTISVDEKVRAKDWGDIALERWSDRGKQTPGWIQKDLACDFIAYAFIPSQRCYLFPFLTLRKAWLIEGRRWCDLAEAEVGGFKVILAKNNGYTTESVAVPIDVLLAPIRQAMIVSWARESEAA